MCTNATPITLVSESNDSPDDLDICKSTGGKDISNKVSTADNG